MIIDSAGKVISVHYRLYYDYLKLIYNMETHQIRATFEYKVEIFDREKRDWESLASPSK
jgi:hypothetical protein